VEYVFLYIYPDHFLVTAVYFLLMFPEFYSSFRGCVVRDFAFVAKKPRCRSLGRSWSLHRSISMQQHHRVCTYSRTRHLICTFTSLSPCVSPIYYYPQALQCDCTTAPQTTQSVKTFKGTYTQLILTPSLLFLLCK
uniref:Uncharacterized protein n=1 Tax=Cyprinus carpio TaxID=7962 RepID=A0A8C2GZN2_CYPCA